RVKVTGVVTGVYLARLKFADGRTCLARNVQIEAGKAFAIEDRDLSDCAKWPTRRPALAKTRAAPDLSAGAARSTVSRIVERLFERRPESERSCREGAAFWSAKPRK